MADDIVPTAPLVITERIVEENGTPSEYFLSQWNLQRGLNTEISGIPALTVRVEDLEALTVSQTILIANNALAITINSSSITSLENINLIAGTGLSGGGDLSGPDRTFNLEDTAVTPGSFTSANITVDQQGRITAVANGSGGGGGDGVASSFTWPTELEDAASSSSNASKGELFAPIIDVNVSQVAAYLVPRSTSVDYTAGVYRIDGSNEIDQVVSVSAAQTGPANTKGIMLFTVDADMVAGSRYIIVISASDQSDTFVLPIALTADGNDDQFVWYPSFPHDLYSEGTNNVFSFVSLAKAEPAIGNAVAVSSTGSCAGIGLVFSRGGGGGGGEINKASAAISGEVVLSSQTEIITVDLTKASATTDIILKLNYEAMNELIKWADASIKFSRVDIKFAGGDGDSLPELIVKVDASVEGISHFIQTSFLYATKFVEVVIFGVAAGARTISVELSPQSTIMVRQRQITVLEM